MLLRWREWCFWKRTRVPQCTRLTTVLREGEYEVCASLAKSPFSSTRVY